MISLLLAMLRARRAQALTVFLLSALATAAAVAGPVAQRTVDLAVVRTQVAQATTSERSISISGFTDPSDAQASNSFDSVAGLILLPGFEVVKAGELQAFEPAPPGTQLGSDTSRVVFRDRVCEHITIVAGRCFGSTLEVVLGENTAKLAGLSPGDAVVIQAARYDQTTGTMQPDGRPATLTLVGTYRPTDVAEAYWGASFYFPARSDGTVDEPVFLSAQTFDAVEHHSGSNNADAIAPPDAFAVDNLDALSASLDQITDPDADRPGDVLVTTRIPELLDRIDRGRTLAAQLVPVAFVPLVAMCLFVIFLSVSFGLVARRPEIGLVRLRGTATARRWWLAMAETSIVIVAGAPVGYLLGYGAVALVATTSLGSAAGSGVSSAALPYAFGAVAGALVVSILGQRRAIAEPVVDLLRGVPKKVSAWRSFAVELILIALAVLGVLQLRATSSGLTGVLLLVPGLVVVALALLASRLFTPAAAAVARYGLRSGRLGSGLAAIQIARRPGSQRLFALLSVALGLLAFVAATGGVAEQGRSERASILVGANTILAVDGADIASVLAATHRADPRGQWAMAAVRPPISDPDSAPMLAVDTARLAQVANWQDQFGISAQEVTGILKPPTAQPMTVTGDTLALDASVVVQSRGFSAADDEPLPPLSFTIGLESLRDGSRIAPAVLLTPGRRTYSANTPSCVEGCRLTDFTLGDVGSAQYSIAVHGLSSGGHDVLTPELLSDRGRWKGVLGLQVAPLQGTLRLQSTPQPFRGASSGNARVVTVDVPLPVPAVATGEDIGAINRTNSDFLPVKAEQVVAMLPRLGAAGSLVDLDYVLRAGIRTAAQGSAEVWLGADAPPDALGKLRAAGLAVRVVTSVAQERQDLEQAGPAMALHFHLAAAALGILLALGGLGLVAAVDRRRRADDLRALRIQGLPRRFVRRAALWGYLWLVLGSAAAGLLAGAVAWYTTGTRLPLFTDTLANLPPPAWPSIDVVLLPWSVASAGMIVAAIVAAWILRVAVRSLVRKG